MRWETTPAELRRILWQYITLNSSFVCQKMLQKKCKIVVLSNHLLKLVRISLVNIEFQETNIF